MNIAKAERLVKPVMDCFCDYTGQKIESLVYLLDRNETGDERQKIFAELKAKCEPLPENCMSETVIGEDGAAVMLYPFNIFSSRDFTHALLHECGHVYFRQVNAEISSAYRQGKLSDAAHMGFALFDEFIAETMANFAENETAYYDEEQRRAQLVHVLYSSIPGINREPSKQAFEESLMYMRSCVYVLPGSLGRYAAMTLTDPTVVKLRTEEPHCDTGLRACDRNTAAEVQKILNMLASYLESSMGGAVCDAEFLEGIGAGLINIWKIRAAHKKHN